jgi:hypothetical protein
MHKDVRILTSERIYSDLHAYVLVDDDLRRHVVHVSESLLKVEPKNYQRRSDKEHLDILAAGAVLLSVESDVSFHRVDAEMVDRAYEAVTRITSIYEFDDQVTTPRAPLAN